jgi:hypothetical protein
MKRVAVQVAKSATIDGSGTLHMPYYGAVKVELWSWDSDKGSDDHRHIRNKIFRANGDSDALDVASLYARDRGYGVRVIKDLDEVQEE